MRLRHKIAASVLLAIPVVVMPASIAHAAEAPADGAKTEASPSGEELDGLDLRVNGGETIHVKEVGECTESAKLKGIVEAKGEEQAKKIEDCFSAASPILPKLSEIVWGGIAWLLVMLVVVKAAVPALKKTMAARSDKIKGDLEAAEAAKSTANAELADYRAKLADAQSEANRIIDEARQSAEGVTKTSSPVPKRKPPKCVIARTTKFVLPVSVRWPTCVNKSPRCRWTLLERSSRRTSTLRRSSRSSTATSAA